MMTYKTAQIAKLVGVHANTIRLYEELKLLPAIPRTKSGYRIFNDRHLEQLRLLRTAFRAEIISDKLRQEVYEIVKTAAAEDMDGAYQSTRNYVEHLRAEKGKAEEAIGIALDLIENSGKTDETPIFHSRFQAAEALGITIDVLRNWERNGLIEIPRSSSRYRKYGLKEMNRLKIIRTLRNAHYSIMYILRMLSHFDRGEKNIREVIDTPGEAEDIVCAADRYLTALIMAEADAQEMLAMIDTMRKKKE